MLVSPSWYAVLDRFMNTKLPQEDETDAESGPLFGAEAPLIKPEELPTWILHEDSELLVFNKPGWVICHPSKNGPWSSLIGAAREYTKLETLHLVARLDRETSGLVLIAKTQPMARKLQMSFEQRMVEKYYFAILEGEMTRTTEVSRAIGPAQGSPVAVKQEVKKDYSGQKAQTTFVPMLTKNGHTLARIQPHTGRKHQIRVHAQWLGFPVVGDKLYGKDETLYLEFAEKGWTERHARELALPRQALHAGALVFLSERLPSYRAPLTEDLYGYAQNMFNLDRQSIDALLKVPTPL